MAASKRVPKVALCAILQPFLALRDDFDAGCIDSRGLESANVPQSATAHPFLAPIENLGRAYRWPGARWCPR